MKQHTICSIINILSHSDDTLLSHDVISMLNLACHVESSETKKTLLLTFNSQSFTSFSRRGEMVDIAFWLTCYSGNEWSWGHCNVPNVVLYGYSMHCIQNICILCTKCMSSITVLWHSLTHSYVSWTVLAESWLQIPSYKSTQTHATYLHFKINWIYQYGARETVLSLIDCTFSYICYWCRVHWCYLSFDGLPLSSIDLMRVL